MVGAGSPAKKAFGWSWSGWRESLSASPKLARWGGFTVILGGALVVLASLLSFLLMVGVLSSISPGYEMYAEHYRSKRLLNMAYALLGPIGALLVPAGLSGVYALPAVKFGKLAKAGIMLACLSGACAVWMTVDEFLPRYAAHDVAPAQVFHAAASFGWMLGLLLVGAPGARALGRWRFSPLVLGPMGVPLRLILAFFPHPPGGVLLMDPGVAVAALIEAPRALSGVGWVTFGVLLLRAREREASLATGESRALARRLYEEAWDGGNLSVVDELVGPDFVDHRHGQRGVENFKHVISDLRATFPDMHFVIEQQISDNDRVATRWKIEGTDEGGLLYYPPTGRRATFTGIFIDRVREGRIVEHRGQLDEAGLFEQLRLPRAGEKETSHSGVHKGRSTSRAKFHSLPTLRLRDSIC